jgi:hypothetical protein
MNEMSEKAQVLVNLLVARATGSEEKDQDYRPLRQVFVTQPQYAAVAPSFLKTCLNLAQFWQFIKQQSSTYAERRKFIWTEFQPLLQLLESGSSAPSDAHITGAIQRFDSATVDEAWRKALDRREVDPDGAITMARTLLESVCKHILDKSHVDYGDAPDLNKLYRLTAAELNLSPSQHTEPVFKQILGGCTAVVEGLGALRNRLSDSHGRGRAAVGAAPRHAQLAVNLAGSCAQYLLATWEHRQKNEPAAPWGSANT